MSLVLITGSCGLVGSESVKFFALKGFDVIGIDNNLRAKFFGKEGDTKWIKNNLIKFFFIQLVSPSFPKNSDLKLLSIPTISNPLDAKNLTDSDPTNPQEPVIKTKLI